MEFVNQFVVYAPVDEAWDILTDVPRIAPCLPGASVSQLPNGEFEGKVSIKVGPIKVSYGGTAVFEERDAQKHTMVLDARARESSGKGSATAVIRADLVAAEPGTTLVTVVTDLQITGKIAQFGRNAMADVGERLIGQFAENLETMMGGGDRSVEAMSEPMPRSTASGSRSSQPARESGTPAGNELDLLSLLTPMLKRAAPALGAFAVGVVLGKALFGGQVS